MKRVKSERLLTDGCSASGDRKLKESTPRLASGRPQSPTMASIIERLIERPIPMPSGCRL